MCIRNKPVVVYDIEVFPNVFHCCYKNTETGNIHKLEISERRNDVDLIVDTFLNSEFMWCGYNNHHFDDVIINYIIDYHRTLTKLSAEKVCKSLYHLSSTIVEDAEDTPRKISRWKYLHAFESMDLLTMQFSQKLRVGLKTMQVTMHYKNVYEYEGSFSEPLPLAKIDDMILYNINDVESTAELLNRLEGDVKLRLFIQDEHGIDCLSMDSVKMAETYLLEEYSKKTGIPKHVIKEMRSPMDYIPLKDVILPYISYENPKLQSVLEDMKKQVVYSKERKGYENKFVISNTVYSVGVGGIHSINTPEIFLPKDGEFIGHSDVASMYPSLLINNQWGPRHLGKIFCDIFAGIKAERLEAKHTGQKLKDKFLKIVLNSPTGKMQQEVSWMYDPLNVFKIRINGQLILLMLVDRLLGLNCKIVQVNTDGVVYVGKICDKEKIQERITELEHITSLIFESNEYEAFYQYAINDYFGVEKGYSQSKDPELIERKGMFITENKLGKGLSPVVIPKAVINFFLTKQPVAEFIEKDSNIRDFLMSQAVDKKFKVVHGDVPVQRINRFYASTNGPYLFKVKKNEVPTNESNWNEFEPEESWSNMLTKSGVTILNKFDDLPIEDRKINYRYYISEAKKIIADFTEKQLELFL